MGFIERLAARPRLVFTIDGSGAVLTATLAWCVLQPYASWFGLPVEPIRAFSIVASIMASYSFGCVLLWPRLAMHASRLLMTIAVANGAYCVATFGLLWLRRAEATRWAALYVLLESVVVAAVIALELRAARVATTGDSSARGV